MFCCSYSVSRQLDRLATATLPNTCKTSRATRVKDRYVCCASAYAGVSSCADAASNCATYKHLCNDGVNEQLRPAKLTLVNLGLEEPSE